jgi:hypothetical protein
VISSGSSYSTRVKLKGSCHCGAVRFSLESETPYPYMWCYCTICRKTAGGGGYAINIMGSADTLKVKGRTKVYRAMRGGGERHFCPKCATALWVWDKRWPQWTYPFASAIDTPLPNCPESTHLMLDFKANWVVPQKGKKDKTFRRYPKESIQEWHERTGSLK